MSDLKYGPELSYSILQSETVFKHISNRWLKFDELGTYKILLTPIHRLCSFAKGTHTTVYCHKVNRLGEWRHSYDFMVVTYVLE